MAKKKKSNLSDAQYQKMYGRPKDTSNKAGTKTKSQSSVSNKKSSKPISSGFTVGYRSPKANANNTSRSTSTSRNVTSQDRINQKSYGATRRGVAPTATSRQRTTPATSAEMRRQNAAANNNLKQTRAERSRNEQKQRFNTAKEMMAARRQTNEQAKAQNAKEWEGVKNTSKEEQQAWFTKKAQEAQQRRTGKVEKGTDNLATSAAKSAFHGAKGAVHSLYGALTRASLQVENETQRDKALAALRGEDVNQAESVAREKAKKRQDLKLAGIRAKTKAEQEKVEEIKEAEAAKDKGPIPLRKMAVGAASFTGQRVVDTALLGPYSLASMGARVLEDERNAGQEKNERLKKRLAESGQFTQEELDEEFKRIDRRSVANAYASSGIEVLSELMFGGIGLSKKYMPEGTRGILDKTVGKLFGNIGKTAAGRLGLGIAEETAEEWIANPVQARVSNMLTGNRLQSLQEESVRREYQKQAMDLKEMQATSADINSDAFLERAKEIYKESGATDKEASKIAELARDYFNADIIGDSDTAEAKLSEITNILAGGENDLREKWTLKDALEVAGEMILSVGAEGFAGAISSSAAGNAYKTNYGVEGVRKLAKVVENLDADKSDRAKAIIDDIDSGKDITGTQVSQIMEWSNETALKAQDREITRDNLVQNRMKDEKLFVPIVDSEYNLSPATDARFEEISDRVADNIDNMGIKMSDVDAYAIADVVAAYETGTISAEQMNELNVENPEARAVFERETGINLDQYTVKDKRGNIKVAESNIKMQKALFSNAADNYMASARIEQENWNNVERGRAAESLTSDMDGMGGVGIQRVLESVDPRNRGDFMLAGSVARRVYDHARLTNDSWEDVRKDFKNAFPGASMDESMRYVYDMAKRTKAIAETQYYGKQVSNKQSLADSETMYVPGNFTNNSERMLGNTELSTLTNMATTLGVNIVMSDNMANKNANGSYDSSTRTITLNADKSMGEMLQFVLAHEVTHHLAAYAPDEYLKLSRFVMDKAYKADAEKFEAAIKNIQKKYKDQAKQDLTPEQALEEIIADNAHEFWQDEAFINDVTSEEPTLAQSIINAIKDILNKLRRVLASGNITDENDRQFLFDEIDSYDQTYKLWMNAFRVARDNQANQAINDWQDEVNERYSLGYHAGDLGKSRVDDYAGQSYSRGTGHFGFGTYFVGDQEQLRYGDYGERPLESVDFDNYNLYKPKDFEKGLALHDALKVLDGYIQDYSDFAKYSDFSDVDEWSKAFSEKSYITGRVNVDLDDVTWDLYEGQAPDAERKARIDDLVEKMPESYREGIEKQTAEYIEKNKDSEYKPNEATEEEYWRYEAIADAVKEYAKDFESEADKFDKLESRLQRAFDYRFSEKTIKNALEKTEEVVKEYGPRYKAERGLDSPATIFMKELGFEGVDVRHIPEMDNTGYGSVIYDLKGEDLTRKKEIGTARFSLNAPVERVKDLVAVHNVKETDLPNMLELGGMPMPSIAVTKASMGHDKYGDISFLFHSDTIDPEKSRYNKVYGGDAYTPTFPAVRYKTNSEIEDKLRNLYYDNYKELGGDAMRGLYRYSEGLEDEMNSAGGEAALIERAKKDTGLMESYLAMQGKPKVEDVYKTEETTLSDSQVEMHEMFIKELGEDVIREVKVPEGENPLAYRKEWFKKHETEIEAAYTKWMRDDLKLDDETIQKVLDDQTTASYVKLFRETLKYLQDGATTTKEVYDGEATREAITKAAEGAGFDAWVDETFKGVEAGKGIRNNKDMFTSMGNRRSWDTLHDPVTLENVVAIMRSEMDTGSNGFFGSNPKGAAQKSYNSLDEIIADEDRLEMLTDEEYSERSDEALTLFTDVCASIVESNPKRFENSFVANLDVGEYVAEVLNETKNKDKMHKLLNRDYGMTVSDEQMDKLYEAIQAISEVPTGYFEAKPKRAVGFDEVRAALVPNNMDKDLEKQLADKGVEIVEYDPEVEGDRTAKLNEVADRQDIKFSLNSEGEELSQGQEVFFERSKNRNAEGQLKVMLHGTDADFTEFDPSKARPGTLGRAFYFSDSAAHAGQYGNVGKYYLNLENPLTGNTHDITKDQLRRFVAYLADNEDYGIENYGADATVDSVTDSVWGGTDFAMLRDLNLSAVGDFAEAVKVFNRVNGTDYDGIITDVETAAFYPEQIKRTDNLNPTLSKDTRYSITDSEGRDLSDGQITYFRNSQARDTQGKLVPVYHTTNRGGFTIFDPSYSDDHRSLFFAASKDISLTYGGLDSNRPVDYETGGQQSGYYECYLNLENPMIIDCRGSDWDRIMADGFESLFVSYRNGDFYVESSDEWLTIDDIRDEYGEGFADAAEAWLDNVSTSDAEIGDLIYTYDGRAFDPEVEGYYPDENDTRTWCLEAEAQGYDGVIFLNIKDIGGNSDGIRLKNEITDVYVAFSSNQVKDVNNLNPTENPDIRYSIVDEDEAKSRMAYEDAIDNSFEALEYYEQSLADLTDEAAENRPIKKFNEDRIAEFYAGLKAEDSVPYSDYVLEEDRVRMAQSKNDYFNNINAKRNDRWTTDGEVLNVKSVKTDVRNLIMGVMSNSDTDSQYKRELVNKTLFDIRTAYQLMKQDRPEVASALLYHSAQRMIDNVEFYVDGTFDQYKELKDYLRNTRISIGEEYWADVEYDAFRKRNFGRMKLVKGRTNVDQIYQQLEEMFPEWFNEEEAMDVPSQLLQIEHVLDSVQPYKEAYSSEAAAELAFDIADDLYEIMVNGDEVRSLADTYKQRYDEKTKAMKQRHAEAMLRVRRARDEGIQAERQKFREYKEQQREKTTHRKEFDSIQKSYDTLTKRLLDNTADSNIPEQYKKDLARLLAAFDLQTVGSKRREARTGWKAQKTIKLEAMRTALKSIENRTDDFYVNDSITDIIDSLLGLDSSNPSASIEGKTIDALNASELKKIDNLLKALVHEFNTYKNVRINARNQQAQDIADVQVRSALDHADKFGAGTDWFGIRGGLDKILNLDEVTPAYLFRQIDRKTEGLGLMWKELERAQDKYIRNTDQLSKWMEEITGKYHNKGRGNNKYGAAQIEEWRRSRSQVEFNLTNGSIKLTPAQMMSVACLANRPQAYQHMVGAGVVVAPVGFQAKMETDLKRKSNRALPLILTDADIKLIVEQLTPEQKKMAEDLQQLMSNQMAEWGNEASMDVIGIRLFEEKDYFPIKSDRAALERDLTPDQFEQAIRNFGFTKAVQPNARNAIMIDDIFDVVTEHCNNMNLYNSYSKALNDFMKVYNKHTYQEDGSDYSVAQALGHAYSQKVPKFIMTFVQDLNGNVSRGRDTGIESMLQTQLANAKKASVFANVRVLLQQPTAITRAFAVISPKYLKGVKIERGSMEEMFEHCPIAKWKSWGYYDINMGKQIEDIIMNEGNFLNDLATQAYGAADNVTWTAIWQMVKAEMKDTHPDLVEGSDEFWYQCNERMREIVDLTQVVDSPMHRSHAMRDKSFIVKMATSFMAEPTLTFNMVRDGYIRAREAWAQGNKKEAASIMNKTMSVYVLQAAAVAAAAAIADALRGKSPDGGDDEEDKTFFASWWANTIANFQDELKIWNKIYYAKDRSSIFEGYEAWNLGTQGITNIVKGYNQMTKKLTDGSKTPWWNIYQNLFGGFGYMLGIPIKTMMKDGRAIFEALGGQLPEEWVGDNKKSEPVVDKDSAFGKILSNDTSITVKEGSALDTLFSKFGLEVSSTKKAASSDSKKSEDGKEESKDPTQRTREEERDKLRELEKKAKEKAEGLSGSELDEALWDVLSDGYTKELDAGNLDYIEHLELIYMNAGGDTEVFRAKIKEKISSSYKKSFKDEMSQEELYDQDRMRHYMEELLDYSDEEVSEICYKTNTARDLKVAFRLNNEEYINNELSVLVRAGLSDADLEKLYKNRNRLNLKTYSGKYKDKLKSTGNYVFPVDGIITSDFGHRSSPGGIGSTNHQGIDIGASQGTPVAAADGGVVVMAGWYGGYGKTVQVKHDDGTITQYSHLSWWDVNEGDTVAQGQEVGLVGSTGNSTGPHLHFGVLKNGEYVDPKSYVNTADKQWDTSA